MLPAFSTSAAHDANTATPDKRLVFVAQQPVTNPSEAVQSHATSLATQSSLLCTTAAKNASIHAALQGLRQVYM